jgi:predicted dehydrogenase
VKSYNFGIVGCGAAAITHARLLAEIDGAKLLGVADKNTEAAKNFAEKYGCLAYESYEAMLADPDVDVVTVATPSYFHKENAISALEAKKHVVLEKPMALSAADCDEIIEKIKESGKELTVMAQMRMSEDVDKVRRLVSEGAFGKISLVELTMKYYRNEEYYSSSTWRGTLKYDGGGALINQGIHGIDFIMYIMGDISRVKAFKKTVSHNIEAEDTLTAIAEFECGALGVIEASTCAYPGFERLIKIHGDRGYVEMTENNISALMVDGEMLEHTSNEKYSTGAATNTVANVVYHKYQVENFISALRGEAKIVSDCYDGKRAVRVIEEIYNNSKI